MLIEKIEFKVYLPNNCLKFAEKYILIHPSKYTSEFLEDLEYWEDYKNVFNHDDVERLSASEIERSFEIFWQDMHGYTIIFNNDYGIRFTEYRKEN